MRRGTAVSPSMSAAAASSASSLRLLSMTLAPLSASRLAMAFPMPFDAPVTRATFPSRVISMAAHRTSTPPAAVPCGHSTVNSLAMPCL